MYSQACDVCFDAISDAASSLSRLKLARRISASFAGSRFAVSYQIETEMESALKRSRQPDVKQTVQCNSIRLNSAGRTLPAPVERSILRFCGLSELGELLVASKAMRALVDSYLQLLQTLRAELLTPSDSERRLLARAGGRVQNLRTFLMNWLRPRPESICAKLRSSLHLAHSAN